MLFTIFFCIGIAIVNILGHASLCICVSLERKMLGPREHVFCILQNLPNCPPKRAAPVYVPINRVWEDSHLCQHQYFANLMGRKWYFVMILIGISQIISEVGHLFICLLAICADASVSWANVASSCFITLQSQQTASCLPWEEQPVNVQRVISCCAIFHLISHHYSPTE